MMQTIADDFSAGAFRSPEPPCLSLYQPTHRSHPANAQDRIRFGNLVKKLEESLRKSHPKRDTTALLAPFHELIADSRFWNYSADGLAVLASPGFFRVYKLVRPVQELAVVADSFHIKPLLRMVQSADDYQILAVSREAAQLYQGNRDGIHEVMLPEDFPSTLDDVVDRDAKKPQPIRTHGMTTASTRHGTSSRADLAQTDTELFFRTVDRAVLERYSRPQRLPLVLMALPENQGHFRQLSHNPFLLERGIDASPTAVPLEELRQRAWKVVEPQYLERLRALTDMFGAARPHGLADADLMLIGRSALSGRVSTLLIEADRVVPGRIDPITGSVDLDDLADPQVNDVLDDLAEQVLATGGQVIIVPSERMPVTTGAAAIYRF